MTDQEWIPIEIKPKLPEGERQEKGIDHVQVTLTLPRATLEMLDRLAKKYSKTRSAYANYLLWHGYHADQETYSPPKKQGG